MTTSAKQTALAPRWPAQDTNCLHADERWHPSLRCSTALLSNLRHRLGLVSEWPGMDIAGPLDTSAGFQSGLQALLNLRKPGVRNPTDRTLVRGLAIDRVAADLADKDAVGWQIIAPLYCLQGLGIEAVMDLFDS